MIDECTYTSVDKSLYTVSLEQRKQTIRLWTDYKNKPRKKKKAIKKIFGL